MSDKNFTYAESRNVEPTNWLSYLDKLEILQNERGNSLRKSYLYEKELKKAKDLAKNWVTCACGNQCKVLTRDIFGQPKDSALRHLGMSFYGAMLAEDFQSAKEILQKIEDRSAKLIQKLNLSKSL
jgi:hypothetical protein